MGAAHGNSNTERFPPRDCRRVGRKRHRMVRLLYLWQLGRSSVSQVLRAIPPRRSSTEHDRPVHCRLPDPSTGSIPLWMDGRPGRPQIYVPHYAQRNGTGYRGDRVDPDLPVDRPDRRIPSLRLADDPGPVPGRRIWRRHHLRCRACAGREPRLLHRLAADLSDSRDRGVAGRDHCDADVFR